MAGIDLKSIGRAGPGIQKAGRHYAGSFGPKPQPPKPNAGKPPKAPGLTATQRTQAAGNAVTIREVARQNANPGMTRVQANEMERNSSLMGTLPKPRASKPRSTTVVRAKKKG